MTREEAAVKVAKLRRLAEKAGTPAEADSARKMADKLMKEHGLTEVELSKGSRAAAFDELLDRLNAYAQKNDIPFAVLEVFERIKKEKTDGDKSAALEKVVGGIRLASLFLGWDKTVKGVKTIIDEVLAKHQVTI
jgi:hypothetical protein